MFCSIVPKARSRTMHKYQIDENRNAKVGIKRKISYLTSIFTSNYITLDQLMKECGIPYVIHGCIEERRPTKGKKQAEFIQTLN